MTQLFLIDDHHMVRDGLRSVLQAAGHTVLGDADAPEGAIDTMLSLGVEVLVLDIHLQSHSGLMVLQQIQERKLAIRTVVLTMSAQPHHISEALRMGALGYVLKGSPSSELLLAIDAVAQGHRFLGHQVDGLISHSVSDPSHDSPVAKLSARETQILAMVVRGRTSAAIALQLSLSPKTVETYRSRLMAKLGITDLPSLVRFAIQWGLIEMQDPSPATMDART